MDPKLWLEKAVIYHIFIDRFSRGKMHDNDPVDEEREDDFCGGTLEGIIDHFDYIRNLNVNAIWLSPFTKTSAYHGYHITDFYTVDPRYGSMDDLEKLINMCHRNQIKVFMDFVPNHMSHKHPFFIDATTNEKSIYRDWFYFKKWPEDYLCFKDYTELPKINLENIEARNHIVNAAKYWVDVGIDGFRLDHVEGPSHNFWSYFSKSLKQHNEQIILFGEAWLEMISSYKNLETLRMKNKYLLYLLNKLNITYHTLQYSQFENVFDTLLDFNFRNKILKIVKSPNPQRRLESFKYKKGSFPMIAFLDNHDMNRFLFECRNDKTLMKKAMKVLFSFSGPKVLYYGTEIGMSQDKDIKYSSIGDREARKLMRWNEIDQDLLDFVTNSIRTFRQ